MAKVHSYNSHNPLSLRTKYSLFSLKRNSSRRLSSLHKRVGKRRHSPLLLCVRADKLCHVLVSWQWSGSRPSGEVAEVKEHGELPIQSNKGNTIKNNADPEDSALHIAQEGNDVVKRAREVEVEEHANGGEVKAPESEKREEENKEEEKKDEEEGKQNGVAEATESKTEETKNGEVASEEAKTGEKRKAEEPANEENVDEEGEKDEASEKKQRTEKTNGAKKSRGRPKKGEAAEKKEKKAPAKKREPKKAATENGEPRRSARNRS